MAESDVAIANMALGHLGITKTIVALTEKSVEAITCSRYYAQVRDEVLRDFAWPFATTTVALALIASDPTPYWSYRYRYPSDAVRLLALDLGLGFITVNAWSAFQGGYALGFDGDGRTLDSNQATATVRYVAQVTDPALFPPDFTAAFALKLASVIAPSVTGGDQFKLGAQALQQYTYQIAQAKATALNEQPDTPMIGSTLLDSRGDGVTNRYDCSWPISPL